MRPFRTLIVFLALATPAWAIDVLVNAPSFEAPASGACDVGQYTNGTNHRYATANCGTGESVLVHVPLPSAASGLLGIDLSWMPVAADSANPGCWLVDAAVAQDGMNYDSCSLTTSILKPMEIAGGQNVVKVTSGSSATLYTCAGGTLSGAQGAPVIVKLTRAASVVSCCVGSGNPVPCCNGAGSGTCTDISGDLKLIGARLDF